MFDKMSTRGVLTSAVGGIVGFAAAQNHPVPASLQFTYIAMASLSSVAAVGIPVVAAPAALALSCIVAPVAIATTYGTGYAAGRIVHNVMETGAAETPLK